ncbi:3-isopropylmalate dehydratase large subunit [Chloroflexota bacterium]
MGMTIIEKILARASGRPEVAPAEYIVAKIDRIMLPGERLGGFIEGLGSWWTERKLDKVFDPEKVVVINEHEIPPFSVTTAQRYAACRMGVKKLGIQHFFDIGRGGICHQVFAEKGFALPGELVVGGDSHTCTYGAFNTASQGMQYDLPYVLTTGETWFRVPPTVRFLINGKLPAGVFSKDVVLAIAQTYGTEIGLQKSLEFTGSTIQEMSISARMTIANIGIELGADFALFEADKKVIDFVKSRTNEPFEPVFSDLDAEYEAEYEIDVSTLTPKVACPHHLGNVKDVTTVAGTKIDQAFLGSCTNARYDDLLIAAMILQGRKIHPDVRLIITPASQEVYQQALNEGLINTFLEAEALVTNATCGACGGSQLGILGAGEVCIGSHNRNYRGRMGSPDAEIYVASPATVVASAIEGAIADPRKYLQ